MVHGTIETLILLIFWILNTQRQIPRPATVSDYCYIDQQ